MGINAFFTDELGASFRHRRMSWGAVRKADKVIFLRVWEEHFQEKTASEARTVWILVDVWKADTPGSFGYRERQGHVERIRAGATSYAVICRHKVVKDDKWEIAGFDCEWVYPIVGLHDEDGETWAVLGSRINVAEVAPGVAGHR